MSQVLVDGTFRGGSARFRLGRNTRRLGLVVHLVASVGWLGVDAVLGVLAVTGLVSDDPERIAAAYTALAMFAVPLLLIAGLTTLASGLVLGLGSRWGVLRYWWVAAKLAINVVLSTLVLVLLRPRVIEAAERASRIDPSLADRLGALQVDLIFPAFVSGVALLVATALGVVKPWGRTPLGRRASADASRQ